MSETEIQDEITSLAWKLLGRTPIQPPSFENDHFSIQSLPRRLSVALENPFRMVFIETTNPMIGGVNRRLEPSLAEELLNRMRAVLVLDELADV